MECCGLSKLRKSWLYWPLMLMMIHILMVGQTHGDCIEEERNALLEIKASHMRTYDSEIDHFLPTWVDYGSSAPGDCCDWERVSCNTTTGHVTELSLYRLRGLYVYQSDESKLWALNVSLFLHFKELKSLNLSFNFLDEQIIKTGLERLSSLKKLEELDLSANALDNDIFPSLMTLTSLKILDLSYTGLNGNFPTNEFAALENLEMLDLSNCGFNGTIEIQDFERVSVFRKLKTLNLGWNRFNESVITSLSTLSSLTNLDLSDNQLSRTRTFPAEELSHLTNLEELDLSNTMLDGTPNIQACRSLSRLRRLESIYLSYNDFNKSIISCLSALPSLKILDLSDCRSLRSSFPVQEFLNLFDLEVLLLRGIGFTGTIPMEDLSYNNFVGSVPSAIKALSSLQALSFAYNNLNGSLSVHGLCELKNLYELDLSYNMLNGILPKCFNSLSSLKLLDISSNQFTGILAPSLIANLTFLEYIDFSHNKFEGSFLFSSFSNHSNLEAVRFRSDNDKFTVETEEPIDWIPMFQLKVLVLSNCKLNKGRVVPGFLLHQHKLQVLDMSHNSLEGHFPEWLIENNTNLEALNLRNNSFRSMPLYWNGNMNMLDMSGNQMISSILDDIPKFFPNMIHLNLSRNNLSGAIPSSVADLSRLQMLDLSKNALSAAIPSSIADLSKLGVLDLSDNELSGEVPLGFFTNISGLVILKLSKNELYGEVLSGNLSFTHIRSVHLDSNHFIGKFETEISKKKFTNLQTLDISNNFFTGMIPDWIGNISGLSELVIRNNSFEGRFPCGAASFRFLDISYNSFSGPFPTCLNLQYMEHIHLGSNRLTGSMANSFRNLTNVLTLDMGNNNFLGRVPEFIGKLSDLRILLLKKNNFIGSIPKQLCQLSKSSLIDLSDNSLSGSIPSCLQNITGPINLVFLQRLIYSNEMGSTYNYRSVLSKWNAIDISGMFETRDEVQFTTKGMSRPYKGDILDYMAGLDLSCNKLIGEIPEELGSLTQIRALNLSHNQLTGPIPMNFSNLAEIESLDLSSNGLTGKVPSELSKLNFLGVFNVSHNNLSGRHPDMKAQFSTFTKASYEGNPLLCGPPLEKKCSSEPHITNL